MTFQSLASHAQKLVSDQSPAILAGIGVTGTITSVLLAGKASFKAARIIDAAEEFDKHVPEALPLDTKGKVKLVWKLYLPAAGTCALTISSIVLATHVGTRRAAALAAAYGVSEKAFSEYKEKVVETLGKNKDQAVRDSVAQDRVKKNPPIESQIVLTEAGSVLCLEPYSGRYFQSSIEAIKKAQNDLNYQVNNSYYASLSDFYDLLGLDRTKMSDDVGWNSDELLEVTFSSVLADDRPCLVMDYKVVPTRDYARVH